MDVREMIKKAKETAKTPDEALLPERFEEYLDLLEMRGQLSKEESLELSPRLEKSLSSLKEVADRVSLSYGMDPASMMEFFSNPTNMDPRFSHSVQGLKGKTDGTIGAELSPSNKLKRTNKNLKV